MLSFQHTTRIYLLFAQIFYGHSRYVCKWQPAIEPLGITSYHILNSLTRTWRNAEDWAFGEPKINL